MRGGLGTPPGGFPEPFRSQVLRGERPLTARPGASLPAVDFDAVQRALEERHPRLAASHGISRCDVLSSLMYPAEFAAFADFREKYTSAVARVPTWAFWRGLQSGDSLHVSLGVGKDVQLGLSSVAAVPTADGHVQVFMQMNGAPRTMYVPDDRPVSSSDGPAVSRRPKATSARGSVGAPMPGSVVEVAVDVGDRVVKGETLATITAMKMVVVVSAPCDGEVQAVHIIAGDQVANGDELFVITEE
eukprot:TRINITY_DN4887_c0_g1_i2.p2 TRINITY_DN4887_c0_g1~~TRINITY_DN4887_c0_g1_i2.p2  ORF type:complete len:245 (-),score=149.66 TRINITY_DN4887_c0_g1_i2:39-773(-)